MLVGDMVDLIITLQVVGLRPVRVEVSIFPNALACRHLAYDCITLRDKSNLI